MRIVATLGKGSALRLWDTATGRQINALPGHNSPATTLAFTPDGSTIVSGSGDQTIRVWDAATGEHRREWPGHRDGVNAVRVTADGKALVSCGSDAVVAMRELATGKELRRFDLKLPPESPDPGTPHQVISVELSADGSRLSAYSLSDAKERAAYHVWDAATGHSLVRRGFERSPGYLALAADGRSVVEYVSPPNARGEAARTIPLAIRDLGSGRIRTLFPPPEEFDLVAALSPDGLTLASVTSRQIHRRDSDTDSRCTLRFWDVPTAKECLTIGAEPDGLKYPVEKMVFSADGRLLATAHSNRSVTVWDAGTGRERLALTRLDAAVSCLAFSPDGRRLVTGHADSTALVWAIPADQPAVAAAPAEDVAVLWAALGAADARRARLAMARLAESPKEAVALLAERVAPAAPFPADKIPGWLKDLSSERFATRQAATRALAALGDHAEPYLNDYLSTNPPQEGRYRALRLLTAMSPIPPAEDLCRMRAIPVLAWIGTPEARAILTRLAAGDPAARETAAAHAALRATTNRTNPTNQK